MAMTATRRGGKPNPNAVIVAARSEAWPIFSTPAAANSRPRPMRTIRGAI
jgi:hypothetical protein